MKSAVMTAALISAAMLSPAQAQTFATANTDVNVRSGPDPQFAVIGMIRTGQRANVIGCVEGSRWCQVDFRGRVGWAYSQYMTLSGQFAAVIPAPEIEVDVGQTVVTAPAPVATYTAPAPVAPYSVAAPAVTYQAPSVAYVPPAVTYRAPTQVVETTAQVVETTAVAPRDYSGNLIAPRETVYASTNLPTAVTPPRVVGTYVRGNPLDPVYLEGNIAIGAGLPREVELSTVPNYRYQYTYVNDYPVLVDPLTRRIVYVYR